MILIVGLGNKGASYENTRHNIGFILVDALLATYDFSVAKEKFHSLVFEINLFDEKIILQKPQTFMNLSGNAVLAISSFYKILQDDIIVIQDDLDLPFMTCRYKTKSGNGGHNGIADIQNQIGNQIHKIKIGIGRNNHVTSHVLGTFSKDENIAIEILKEKFCQNFELLIKKDFNTFIKNIEI